MEQRTALEKIWRFIRRYNRYIKVTLISLVALAIAMLPTEVFGVEGLNPIQQRVIAIFVWAACMWIVEAVPAWTTSLLIIVIMLLTVSDSAIAPLISGYDKSDLMSYKVIMNTFANPTVMLFMGGFILALVASKSGVDVSMARAMLKPFGSKPSVLLFGFMLVTAIFSMFVSNTATAAMMLTFLAPVLRQLPPTEKGTAALALAIPIGANIGGLATPIGTPPNGIALQYINGELGLGVDFGEWMMVMTPLMLVILVLSWVLLRFSYPFTAKKVNMHIMGGAKKGWRTYVIYGTLAVTIL
ncbi:MAG: anion permease, partial [Bacteroidaceae bacterium]|nr:anion permease [Bacteroidaceae bacterium]